MMRRRPAGSIHGVDGAGDPCLTLWRAVVVQAFHDAESRARSAVGARREARAFLLSGDDLAEICELAELDCDAVRATAADLDRAGWPRVDGRIPGTAK